MRIYFDENNREMYDYIYELYLAQFPKDSRAATILYMLGEQRWKLGLVNDRLA